MRKRSFILIISMLFLGTGAFLLSSSATAEEPTKQPNQIIIPSNIDDASEADDPEPAEKPTPEEQAEAEPETATESTPEPTAKPEEPAEEITERDLPETATEADTPAPTAPVPAPSNNVVDLTPPDKRPPCDHVDEPNVEGLKSLILLRAECKYPLEAVTRRLLEAKERKAAFHVEWIRPYYDANDRLTAIEVYYEGT